jgi:hypothetical protein
VTLRSVPAVFIMSATSVVTRLATGRKSNSGLHLYCAGRTPVRVGWLSNGALRLTGRQGHHFQEMYKLVFWVDIKVGHRAST